jgi:glycosyltransferase involved in cell wall biosynthesis
MTETIPNKYLPTVSVVILNWNGKEFLARCLEAVYSQTYQDFEVILIDNASRDGSIEEVEIRWPKVRVIRL